MDPNTALADLRAALADAHALADRTPDPHGHRDADNWRDLALTLADTVDALALAAGALDQWISRGGFLPDAWRRTSPEEVTP